MKTSTKPRRTTKTRPHEDAGLLELAGVDEGDRAAYEKLLHEMEAAGRDEKRGWDRRWEAAGTIVARKLFVLSDTPTAEQWLPKHTGEEYRTAVRNIRVARFRRASSCESTVVPVERRDGLSLRRTGRDAKPGATREHLLRCSAPIEGATRGE